jgi:uncharacterized membrane protein
MNSRPLARAAGRCLLATLLAVCVAGALPRMTTAADPQQPQQPPPQQQPPQQHPPRSASQPATRPAAAVRKVRLLYVDGYPRWDYRYISRLMIREPTVDVSCFLTSADDGAAQPADPADPKTGFPGPIKGFPDTMDELLRYDVVLLGDVDPRVLTDKQLHLVAEFVRDHGGGFAMAAGPRHSPHAYRGSPVEVLLPVKVGPRPAEKDDKAGDADGFRPVLTDAGAASSLFRGLVDPAHAAHGGAALRADAQPFFWYCRGVTAADGATVLAVHPTDAGPDGKRAPLVVIGQAGKGRTAFVAVDDTWRWRFQDKDGGFETYWVELVRSLAAGRVEAKARTRPAGDK